MATCKMKVELFCVIIIYLRSLFVYHQSIMVPVKVDIDPLIELRNINTFISPHFSVSREDLIHWLMILKIEENDDTRSVSKFEINIEIRERKYFASSLLVLIIKSKSFLEIASRELVPIKTVVS